MTTRKALVCGAGGFIGGWLSHELVTAGWDVTGVDRSEPQHRDLPCRLKVADLRDQDQARKVVTGSYDVVFQLAADMGGMDFIEAGAYEIAQNSTRINLNVLDAACRADVGRYLLASSVCVYRDMSADEGPIAEDDAWPAQPDNLYGLEKLYAERALYAAASRGWVEPRVARFENCYGPYGAYEGGREKAPAAISRKVAQAVDGGTVEVYGGGKTRRSFVYVADLVRAVVALAESSEDRPTNVGVDETVWIYELVELVAEIAGKRLDIEAVEGVLGVESRNFSHDRVAALGWKPEKTLREGMELTYAWVEAQLA